MKTKNVFLNVGATAPEPVELRSMDAFAPAGGVVVDPVAGVIRNVVAMTAGPANGHGFEIDRAMLGQVASAINSAGTVKSRMGHPPLLPDGAGGMMRGDAIGMTVGHFSNAHVDGDKLRGDVTLGDYAESMPSGGNARKYLLGIAGQHPSQIGLSVVFSPDKYVSQGPGKAPLGRVKSVSAVDFVDTPAATRNGLLSVPPEILIPAPSSAGIVPLLKGVHMDPALKAYLVSLGLDPTATDGEAKAYLSALGRSKQVALCAAGHAAAYKTTLNRDAIAVLPAAPKPVIAAAAAVPIVAAAVALSDPGDELLAEEGRRHKFLSDLQKLYSLSEGWDREQVVALAEIPAAEFHATAKKAALKHLAENRKPFKVQVGDDNNLTSLSAAIEDAVFTRANPGVALAQFDADGNVMLDAVTRQPKPRAAHERTRAVSGLTLLELGRVFLSAIGVKTDGLARQQVAALLFDKGQIARRTGDIALSLGVGDFPGILAAVMNKALRTAYQVTPVTWDQWARRDTNPDFKPAYRLQLSETDIAAVAAGQEYEETPLVESKETYTLAKYGRIISFNWETMVNDDLNAFGQVPRKMGNACRRKEDEVAYAVLTSNQVMTEDNVALFNSAHNNLAAGAATSPWYLVCDPNMYDTVVVAFLEGENGPVFQEEDGFTSDKRRYKVRHVVTARALDFRGMYKSLAANTITIAGLAAGKQAMITQKDVGGKDYLALDPAILLVGAANEIVAKQLIGSPVDPTKSNNTPNPFQGSFKVIATPRLP